MAIPMEFSHVNQLEPLLRAALSRATELERNRQKPDASVRTLLSDACRIARAEQIPPEHIIVAVKQWWGSAHESGFANRTEAQAALDGLVTACIEAYFDNRDGTQS